VSAGKGCFSTCVPKAQEAAPPGNAGQTVPDFL
jgi:hypothetical protein